MYILHAAHAFGREQIYRMQSKYNMKQQRVCTAILYPRPSHQDLKETGFGMSATKAST